MIFKTDPRLIAICILLIFLRFIAVFPAQLPCDPSPCGANAVCKERNGAGSCTCLPDYTGDPYEGCRPECVQNSDCAHTKACINNKCKDPCVGACGINAQCQVYNHQPSCSCLYGYTGDPLTSCHIPLSIFAISFTSLL